MKGNDVFAVDNLNLWYSHGRKHALKNISIKVRRNDCVAFIGPSGCGKSTFLRCLNRMNDGVEGVVVNGSIVFDGESELIDPSSATAKWLKMPFTNRRGRRKSMPMTTIELRTRVGMVFQKPNPFPMSIYDNVAFGPRSSGIRSKAKLDAIVKESLESAALWDEVKDHLRESAMGLSGGQQQRLCIARAIAMQPEVLLMDEPTASLDPIAAARIEELISELKGKFTIVIVTHSMQQAARVADMTAFFYLGELVEYASTRKIFTNPAQKLTGDYINGRMG